MRRKDTQLKNYREITMREIIQEPNELLHIPCKKVTDFDEAQKITDDLLVVIKSASKWWNRWLGFAANQIGYSKRVIVLRKGKNEYDILINPTFIARRFPFPHIETCYSLNREKYYLVKRYLWAKIKYQNMKGEWYEEVLRGPSAIYQEMDHLNGIMVSEIGIRIL